MIKDKIKNLLALNEIAKMSYLRNIIFVLVGVLVIQLIASIVSTVSLFTYISINYPNDIVAGQDAFLRDARALSLVNNLTYVILFVIMMACCIFLFKNIFSSFLKVKNIILGIIMGLVVIFFNFCYSLIISSLKIGANTNQSTIQSFIDAAPVLSFIIIGFIAPACEELTYRVGLFGLIAKWKIVLAYVFTSLLFALIHFDFNFTSEGYNLTRELLNLPNYIISGILLAFAYHKGGFAASFIAHSMNNVLSVILILVG